LAEALKVNSSIANIGLAANSIGDEGAKAWRWASVLKICQHAKQLRKCPDFGVSYGVFGAPKS